MYRYQKESAGVRFRRYLASWLHPESASCHSRRSSALNETDVPLEDIVEGVSSAIETSDVQRVVLNTWLNLQVWQLDGRFSENWACLGTGKLVANRLLKANGECAVHTLDFHPQGAAKDICYTWSTPRKPRTGHLEAGIDGSRGRYYLVDMRAVGKEVTGVRLAIATQKWSRPRAPEVMSFLDAKVQGELNAFFLKSAAQESTRAEAELEKQVQGELDAFIRRSALRRNAVTEAPSRASIDRYTRTLGVGLRSMSSITLAGTPIPDGK